jgi:SAM-dependent methyltransferase
LDVGCGPLARAEVYFGRKECKIVAVDVSVANLLWNKRNLTRFGVQERVELVAADAERLPFREDCFSKVLAMGLLVHLPSNGSALSALREICRCLKRDGACYVDWCLNMYSVFGPSIAFANRVWFIGKKERVQIFNFKGLEEIRSIFRQAGLEIFRTFDSSILWYGYYLLPTWFHRVINRLISVLHDINNRYPRVSFFAYSFDFIAGK